MKQKFLKKGISLVLSLIMCFSICVGFVPQTANAAEKVNFTAYASSDNLLRGDTVTYSVDMSQNVSGTGLDLLFVYDDSVLELQSTEEGVVFDGLSDLNDTKSGVIHITIVSNNILENGNVFTATFKVKDTEKGAINAKVDRVELIDDNYEDVTCDIINNTMDVVVSIPAEGISLNETELTLAKGNFANLIATVVPEEANAKIEWSSSALNVATVDEDGKISAIGKGTTTIIAKAGSYSASCQITVTVPLEDIKITGTTDTLKKGQTTQLEVVFEPTDTTDNKDVIWSSSDTSIATVSANGTVVALKDGVVTITAVVGDKTDTYEITVQEIKLTSINMEETMTIHKGEMGKLTVTFTPSNTTDDTMVTWSSSDESVATVDMNGKVFAKSAGAAIITAKIGNLSAKCMVTVDVPLKEIIVNTNKLELTKNQTSEITYRFNPEDTTDDKTVAFVSSDVSVATVDENGKVVAKKEGKTTITITATNGVSTTVEVAVKEIPIDEIVLDKESVIVEVGDIEILYATIKPENNTDDDQTITWTSSNEKVVKVEADTTDSCKVTVKAISGGTAVITAEAWNGTKVTCTVKVPKHIESIALPELTEILRGTTKVLDVVVNPMDAEDDASVTWISSNPEIAMVDKTTGMITALKEGTVEITATTNTLNGKTGEPFTATATVVVKENHFTPEMGESISFGELEVLLKGQRFDLNDVLNLQVIIEEHAVTDDIYIEWNSSDEEIASIEQSGIVYGVKTGEVTITANITAINGAGEAETYEATAALEVKEIPLETIAFDKVITEMQVGATDKLNVIYNPENTTDDRNIIWISSDNVVLSVDNGVITAKKTGIATITAHVGEQKVSCEITVKDTEIIEPDVPDINDDNTSNKDESVSTGDTNNIMFYIVILVCSFVIIILSVKKVYIKK